MDTETEDTLWYAVRVRPNFEKTTAALLEGKHFEVYLPMYRERRRWSDRFHMTDVPLFPGYLFARFVFNRRLGILMTPGVLHVVPPHAAPIPVDERELDAVRRAVGSGLPVGPHPFLETGQRVVIQRGALAGLEGILAETKKAYRVVVSVTLLQRSVSVEVDREWIEPVSEPPAQSARSAC